MYNISGGEGMIFHWEIEGGYFANKDTLNDTIYVVWNGIGEHRLRVYGEFEGCYTDYRELLVQLKHPPIVDIGGDVAFCQGESYTFQVDSGYSTIEWHDKTLGRWYTTRKSETVIVKVTNNYGCAAFDSAKVTVYSLPIVDLGPDTILCGNDVVRLDAYNSNNISPIYKWNVLDFKGFEITDPDVEVSKPGKYFVTVTDAFGCVNSDTININECPVHFDKTKISTIITPNNDGKNDTWKIEGLSENYPDVIIEIYDRWGRLVYRSEKGYPEPWNGKDKVTNKDLPMANYFYIIYLNKKGAGVITGTVCITK